MKDRMIRDLVDSYLLNQINADDKAKLLAMMEADPVFAQYVKESEETFKVLQSARDRELHEKLKAWDVEAEKPKHGRGKRLLFFLFFVFLFVSFWCWLSYHFSPVTMAIHSFNAIPQHSIQVLDNSITKDEWEKAIETFRHKDFEKAMFLFMTLAETDDPVIAAQSRWNILLCQLALNGPTNKWLEELDGFSKNASEPIHSEAEKLFRKIHSPLYTNLYRGILHKTFTSVKPKII